MIQSSTALEIQARYQIGERNFQGLQLRRSDLRGINLSDANLQQADLSYANLRDGNLQGANLSGAYLNEADLTGANLAGANLQGASLIKTYFIKANLQGANLSEAYLTGAYVTKGNLKGAYLNSAYLNGAKLSGTDLTGAYYDTQTHFDGMFDPVKAGMQHLDTSPQPLEAREITIEELLKNLNYLSQLSNRYLGNTTTTRYWELSRPQFEWLKQFQINRSAQITFSGSLQELINLSQYQWIQEWMKAFIASCRQIIQDFPQIIDPHTDFFFSLV